jgi:hypothetical protein
MSTDTATIERFLWFRNVASLLENPYGLSRINNCDLCGGIEMGKMKCFRLTTCLLHQNVSRRKGKAEGRSEKGGNRDLSIFLLFEKSEKFSKCLVIRYELFQKWD